MQREQTRLGVPGGKIGGLLLLVRVLKLSLYVGVSLTFRFSLDAWCTSDGKEYIYTAMHSCCCCCFYQHVFEL